MSDIYSSASLNQTNAAYWAQASATPVTGNTTATTQQHQPVSAELAMTGEAISRAHALMQEVANRLRGPRPEAVGEGKGPTSIIDMARANRQRAETLADYLAELLGAL